MAVFRVPRITTVQRLPLLLDEGEIVFDTDLKTFFGGDGITLGGKELCYCDGNEAIDGVVTTENNDMLLTEDGSYIEFEFAIFTTESGDIITTQTNDIIEV